MQVRRRWRCSEARDVPSQRRAPDFVGASRDGAADSGDAEARDGADRVGVEAGEFGEVPAALDVVR